MSASIVAFKAYLQKKKTIVISFLILFIMLSVGCEKQKNSPDPEIVATYEGGRITRKQVKERIDGLLKRVEPDMVNEVQNIKLYKSLIRNMAVDQMAKAKIEEKKLDEKDSIKHAMKHISEEININEMHSRAHDGKIKVSETDIEAFYENNRTNYQDRPLNEVKEEIRGVLQEKQETLYFKNYMEDLKKNAVVTREDSLLKVPAPTETDLTIYFEENRKKYNAPEKSFSDVKDQVSIDLGREKEEEWFRQNKDRTLFTIHGKRHTVGEFYEEFNELPSSEQKKYQTYDAKIDLLDRIIQRLLIVEDTDDQMLGTETKEEVSHAREDILRQLLHQEEVDDKLEVKDEEVAEYYEKHKTELKKPPQVQISYIRVGSGQDAEEEKRAEQKAQEAYKKLNPGFFKKGEPFEKIAVEYSEDPETAKNGGKLDRWISEGENIIEEISSHGFHENVMHLAKNEIGSPFQFNGSWYIVMVRERKEPEMMLFKDVQESLRTALYQQKHEEQTYGMSEALLKQANLVIYDNVIKSMLKTNK